MLACATLALAAPVDSQAMTDAQHRQFLKTSQDYRAADAQLNSVWRALKSRLSPAEFRQLLQEQRQWISTKREAEAKELIGQSIPEVDAYTATITSRVNELTERLGKLDNKAAKPEAKPAPAATPAEKPVAPAKAEQAAKPESKPAAEPAAKPEAKPESKPAAAAAGTPDKPARVEIGLPFLDESKATAPAAKPESKPAAKPEAKPAPKPEAKAPAAKTASAPATDPCSDLRITSIRHFGNNVAAPFVEMVLRNDLIRNVKAVRVNGHEIKRAIRPVPEKPIWRVSSPRTVALDVFAHTILNTIDVEYADGPVCTIDKSKEEKDFTDPYVF